MGSGNNDLFGLFDIALGIAQDKAFYDSLIRVQAAHREYLITQADENRLKARGIIDSMVKLDIERRKFEVEFRRIEKDLSQEAKEPFLKIIHGLQTQRQDLINQKKNPSLSGSFSAIPQISSETVNGIPLLPGDVLAASRKAGLYQHFAIYIGNQRVIHYAAENGDFSGRITIHEAPYKEFQGDSTFIYVLDFPDNSGRPTRRGQPSVISDPVEAPFFDLIRKTDYHLYSPEETVARAKSRIGEEKYALPFNNCEHFAIWCKTGVHESHQVNVWLTRLSDLAHRYNG